MNRIYVPYAGHEFLRDRLEPCLGSHPSVIAIRRGEIIGFAYTLSFAPDIVELGNIFVPKSARSAGVGGEMLRFIEDNLNNLQSYIIAVNSSLRKVNEVKFDPTSFYVKNGFEILKKTEDSTIFWRKAKKSSIL